MDYKKVAETLQNGLKDFLGDKNAVIGISGGIDSAVVASLCLNAVGQSIDRVIGIQMPYGEQSTKDGSELINHLGIRNHIVDIKPIASSLPKELVTTTKLTNGNIRARVRMILLYATANEFNGMVIGTGNKTELMLGYFTKYGDGGCDIEPIGDLYKTEVFGLAKYLGVPDCIINKKPSAELWEGQTDEGEIGMSYAEMDTILRGLERGFTMGQLEEFKSKYGREKVENIMARIVSSEHKRNMPKTIVI